MDMIKVQDIIEQQAVKAQGFGQQCSMGSKMDVINF